MKIVKIKGGLGNQMFQYAFACLVQKTYGEQVSIDMSAFEESNDDVIRRPRLLKMNTRLKIASQDEINQEKVFKFKFKYGSLLYKVITGLELVINRKYFFETNREYIPIEEMREYSYFDGYWQSWKYVNQVWDILKNDFLPNYDLSKKTKMAIEDVRNTNSVFIGIRRGDYVADKKRFGSFDNRYFQKAMNYVEERVENPVFYVFSNDIDWVKNNIDFKDRNVIFREKEDVIDDFEELMIMSNCKHSIIINSTFHWWGARLNDYDGKIVVAPDKWFFDNGKIDIVPPHWKTISTE